MGRQTGIQWTGATWNIAVGCHRVSQGCKKCYMFRDMETYGRNPDVVVRTKPATFEAPLKWQREAERGDRAGTDRLVFACSWSDWFIEEIDAFRAEAWAIVRACPLLTFQVLTKRTHRIAANLPPDWGAGWPNVWLGASVEDRATADARIPDLVGVRAAARFLSVEPLLQEVDLGLLGIIPKTIAGSAYVPSGARLHWVIVGGESGMSTGKYQARRCELGWIRSVVRQCREAEVPVFVKQLGSCAVDEANGIAGARLRVRPDAAAPVSRRLKDSHGGDMDEWPDDLKIREFPEVFARAVEAPKEDDPCPA